MLTIVILVTTSSATNPFSTPAPELHLSKLLCDLAFAFSLPVTSKLVNTTMGLSCICLKSTTTCGSMY